MSRTIEVSDETYELIKDQFSEEEQVEVDSLEDFVGKKVFIRTVTYHCLGEVVKKIGNFFELKNASWVADTGRFMQFVKKAEISSQAEIEPVGAMWVNTSAIVDIFNWKGSLPKDQK